MPSSAIRSFDYDAARHELTVSFVRGRTYVYGLVPAAVAAGLAASPSPGAFHNGHIRDRYPYREVKAAAPSRPSLREALTVSIGADERDRDTDEPYLPLRRG